MSKKVDLNKRRKNRLLPDQFSASAGEEVKSHSAAAAALDTQHRFTKGHEFAGNIETRVDRHQQSTEMKVSSIL